MGAIESIMDHIAYEMNIDPVQVRLANTSPTKLPKLMDYWNDMNSWADIAPRKKAISKFNKVSSVTHFLTIQKIPLRTYWIIIIYFTVRQVWTVLF